MSYLLLKHVHASLALISITGFVIRWYWRMTRSALANTRVVRIMPHVIDTLFLASAVVLGILPASHSLGSAWFSAKISGLVLYILFGMAAMRTAPALRRSLPAFLAAVVIFAWIVSVAMSKSALGFLRYLA